MSPTDTGALWRSPFRPFYLLGALYAPLLVAAWLGAWLGLWSLPAGPLKLLHGHEFVYGFATAIIAGIVLTALPSWAGTEELRGPPLIALAALWLAGRLVFWAAPWLPWSVVALVDCLLFPAMAALVTPGLLRTKNRLYLLLLPVLLALALGNFGYHLGMARTDPPLAERSLRLAVYAVIVLYGLKGGVLAPIFTGNALREKGRGEQVAFCWPLELAVNAAVLLLASVDLGGAPAVWTGAAALAAAALHGWRTLRWRGWMVADVPLVLLMHLGFAWLVLALALKAAAGLGGALPEPLWLHAFTLGSLGLMMLGLMTRVSLRHTGRPLRMPRAMSLAAALVFAAAVLRLAAGWAAAPGWLVPLSALLWCGAFVLYLVTFWRALVTPSLPR